MTSLLTSKTQIGASENVSRVSTLGMKITSIRRKEEMRQTLNLEALLGEGAEVENLALVLLFFSCKDLNLTAALFSAFLILETSASSSTKSSQTCS